MDFQDKICVITGGANGIGLCLVNAFAEKGAAVAFIDIDRTAGTKAMEGLTQKGSKGLFYCGDIAEHTALEEFSEQVIHTYGKVDFLINNACLSRKGILSGCDYESFNYVLAVGVTAPYLLSKLFLPYFAPNSSIVNISSSRAVMSQPDTESYTAAKGGISSLTHALAVSLAGRVRVNSISPGWIETGSTPHSDADRLQHPAKRVGAPEDIARVALFLCEEGNSFLTGETITVDGGMTKQMVYHGDCGWFYRPEQ